MRNSSDTKTCSMVRTTFVIDPKGILLREWRGVQVANHAAEVLNFISSQ